MNNSENNENGSVLVLIVLVMVGLTVLCAFVVDIGIAYVQKSKLQNAVDASVLAAAQELPDTSSALDYVNQYIDLNGFSPADTDVSFSNENQTITVTGNTIFNFIFAKVLGYSTGTLTATASATLSTVGGASGVIPLGLEKQTLEYGETYTLKEGGGSGHTGNYGAIALGGTGASVYEDRLKHGYSEMLTVGQSVDTEPGNMKGPTDRGAQYRIDQDPTATFDTVQKGSPRIVIIPVMETMDVNGRKPVTIVGFAVFFLQSSSDGVITGKFMKMAVNKSIPGSGADYGAHTLKLTN